ncbi:hypothetical protein K466DRAFT_663212 [Polyporus arcularius HHB13444]|uniref:Uncharacterized protein n=1 Tax=Polyporus arcularius HHB13444 TaxID=1314778 RepID=A0A5C3PDT2_9APHY|nr:hypothetical protein K466DRAFT_663212 [Polyporus arcularius HHB13444]
MSAPTKSFNAVDHPVKAATIFQSSTAELTRAFSGGRNVLEITGLSSHVDTESPRIHGLDSDARVFDISCDTRLANAPGLRPKKHADAVKKLESNIKILDIERNVHRNEYDMLDQAVKSLANGTPAQMDAFMDRFVQRKLNAMTAVMKCEEAIESLNKELWLLNNDSKGETAGRVIATILAKRPCTVTFQLTYLVTGVSWQPYYDLHASTSEGKPSSKLLLLYCAYITQSTGEDWTNAALTLSTANSQALRNLSVPVIDPLQVTPARSAPQIRNMQPPRRSSDDNLSVCRAVKAPPLPSGSVSRTRQGVARFPQNLEEDDFDVVEGGVDYDISGPPTSVNRSPLSLAYRVDGLVTLPSDGVAHKVSIAALDFSAELKYVCVPRKSTSAFIQGTVKNTSEYELLAGPVSVFMDEGFVTKTFFNLIGVDESFDCVFGIDSALRVTYTRKSQTEHEPARSFAEPTKTTTRTITTTVTNGHAFDISALIIRDSIPLGNEDANIKVMLRKPDGLARVKDGEEITVRLEGQVKDAKARWSKVENGKGGEKDGMYEWVCALPAGETVSLEAEWAVKAPSSVKWEEVANKDGDQKD